MAQVAVWAGNLHLSGVSKIFIITRRTDMRKSFDGLMGIIRDTYELDPYANVVYLFCGMFMIR